MIPHKMWNGLQAIRLNNYIARVMPGSCASLAAVPSGPRKGQGQCLLTVTKRIDVDIRQSAIDRSGNLILGRKDWAFERGSYAKNGTADSVGGILNGLSRNGVPEDGIYYGFICSSELPDANGIVPEESVYLYLSKYFIGAGHGSAATGVGEHKRPKNIRFFRPHPACWMVQDGKLVPWLSIGESHTSTMYYQFADWQPYKSARYGGVKFDNRGRKFYDPEAARVLQPGELHGSTTDPLEYWLSFEGVIPQTHKVMSLQIEFGGRGEIHASVTQLLGQLVAVANGPGVARFDIMTGSDLTGRGIKLTLTGPVTINRVYMLSCTSQQPM